MKKLKLRDAGNPDTVLDFMASVSMPRYSRWTLTPCAFDRCMGHRATRDERESDPVRRMRLQSRRESRKALCDRLELRHRFSGTSEFYCANPNPCAYRREAVRPSLSLSLRSDGYTPIRFAGDRKTRTVLSLWGRCVLAMETEGGILAATAKARRTGEWEVVDALAASEFPKLTEGNERREAAQRLLATCVAAMADATVAKGRTNE